MTQWIFPLIFGLVSNQAVAASASARFSLNVVVGDVQPGRGRVIAAVFSDPAAFPAQLAGALKKVSAPATAKQITLGFADLPEGDYAVSVFQDFNSNGVLALNPVGNPIEPVGVSNNVAHPYRGSRFEEAQIHINSDRKIEVLLR